MATAETESSSIFFVTKFDRIWSTEHLRLNYENECFNDKLTQQRWQDAGHVLTLKWVDPTFLPLLQYHLLPSLKLKVH